MDCITNPADTAACKAAGDKPLIVHLAEAGTAAHLPPGQGGADKGATATSKEVAAGTIPALTLEHGPVPIKAAAAPAPHHWYDGALAVAEDVAVGAYKEVTEHPLHIVESFAVGVGTAALASVVATPVAIGATVLGVGYGAYELYKHAPGWVHSAEDVYNPEGHSAEEMAKAHHSLQGFGGGAADLAAAVGGGFAYRAASSAISAALEDAGDPHVIKTAAVGAATTNDGGASAQAGAIPPSDGGASAQAGAIPPGDGGASAHGVVAAHHAVLAVQPPESPPTAEDLLPVPVATVDAPPNAADISAVPGQTLVSPLPVETPIGQVPGAIAADAPTGQLPGAIAADAVDAAPAMTPEELAMANSIKTSQGVFTEASQDGGSGVIESTKQLYNVRFEKVTEDAGRRLFTLENRTEGVLVPKGAFIATRLDAAGNPVIEDGIENSWSMQAAKIGKTYQVEPATLENSTGFVAPTRVDGPSVHMVKLDQPTDIITKWGAMKGKIGDWLANYDFDKTTGTPGKDYAIVSGPSYSQTYQPKPKL